MRDAPSHGLPTTRPRATAPGARARLLGLLRACRPRQWVKNALVFAAPLTAGVLTDPRHLGWAGLAFALFCLAASGGYLLNDARDAGSDRLHERKRCRPVAAGLVPVPLAVGAGVALATTALLAAVATGNWWLSLVLAGYVLLTALYTLGLKRLAVCDIVAVAGCHVLRALAGAVAVDVPVTSWFLIVVSLGALLAVTGKREAEIRNPGSDRARATLARYSAGYLEQVRTMASAAMVVTYCLWALENHEGAALWFHGASLVPFIMALLRYNLLVNRGIGEEPEEIALRDRPLQAFLAVLVILVTLGVYVA